MTDPIADMLSRIRNGYLAGKKTVSIPHSRLKEQIARILEEEHFIRRVEQKSDKDKNNCLRLTLYYHDGSPAITGIKRWSKPGLRKYQRADKIPFIRKGSGIFIVSTDQGLMTDTQARKKNLGGEILCQVWF